MANTVHNFWSMVHECDVHLIVMLTEVSGVNKVVCDKKQYNKLNLSLFLRHLHAFLIGHKMTDLRWKLETSQ